MSLAEDGMIPFSLFVCLSLFSSFFLSLSVCIYMTHTHTHFIPSSLVAPFPSSSALFLRFTRLNVKTFLPSLEGLGLDRWLPPPCLPSLLARLLLELAPQRFTYRNENRVRARGSSLPIQPRSRHSCWGKLFSVCPVVLSRTPDPPRDPGYSD